MICTRDVIAATVAAICLSTVAVPQTPAGSGDPEASQVSAVTKWLGAHAVPLKPFDDAATTSDVQSMVKALQAVRVVGLGEASHGTREFFQFKSRMIRFLVEKMGYKAVTIEASLPACLNIDDYVVYGKGDAAKALISQGFAQLDTEEELSLIEWLHQYNSRLPEAKRVRFFGIDMQGGYEYAIDSLTAYLKKVAPDQLAGADEALAAFRGPAGKPAPIDTISAEAKQKAKERLDALASLFAAGREKFVKQSTRWEYGLAALQLRVLQQGAEFRITMSKSKEMSDRLLAVGMRDKFMAENVETEAELLGPGARIIVSGHNGHVQTGPWGAGLPALPGAHITAMGEFLRKQYGRRYYVIGTDFDHGSFQALGRTDAGKFELQEFTLSSAPQGSLPWYLHQAAEAKKIDAFLIDLRTAPHNGPVGAWLLAEMPMSILTGAFSRTTTREQAMAPVAPGGYFDALAFVDHTTRAQPIANIPE